MIIHRALTLPFDAVLLDVDAHIALCGTRWPVPSRYCVIVDLSPRADVLYSCFAVLGKMPTDAAAVANECVLGAAGAYVTLTTAAVTLIHRAFVQVVLSNRHCIFDKRNVGRAAFDAASRSPDGNTLGCRALICCDASVRGSTTSMPCSHGS